MKDSEEEKRWVLCPWCGAKTRLQILWETELVMFRDACPDKQYTGKERYGINKFSFVLSKV